MANPRSLLPSIPPLIKLGVVVVLAISIISFISKFSLFISLVAIFGCLVVGITLFYKAGYFPSARNLPIIGWVVGYLCSTASSTASASSPPSSIKINANELFNHLKTILIGQDDLLRRLANILSLYIDRENVQNNNNSVILIFGEKKAGKTSLQQGIGIYLSQYLPQRPVFIRSNDINPNIGINLAEVKSSLYLIDDFEEVSVSYQSLLIKEIDRLHSARPIVFLIFVTLTSEEMLSLMKKEDIRSKQRIDDSFDLYLGADIFNGFTQNIKSRILLSCGFPRISIDVLQKASSYFLLTSPDTKNGPEICLQRITSLARTLGISLIGLDNPKLTSIFTDSIEAAGNRNAPGYWLLEIEKQFHDDIHELKNRGIKTGKLIVDQNNSHRIIGA